MDRRKITFTALGLTLLLLVLLAGWHLAASWKNIPLGETGFGLCQAAESGDAQNLKKILASGVDPDSDDGAMPALMVAANNAHTECVQILIDHGANVNIRISDGYTPLLCAATKNADMVRSLLLRGADIRAQDIDGMAALMIASANADLDIVNALLSFHADVNMKDNFGQTALMKVASIQRLLDPNSPADVASALIKHGADVNMRDKQGRTALMLAQTYNHPDIVILLKKAGAKE